LWMTRLSDKGTTLTIDASMNIGDNRSDALPEQYIFNTLVDLDKLKDMEYDEIIAQGNPFMIYNQKNNSRNKSMRLGSNLSLNHPISNKVQLSFEYRFNYNNSDSKRNSYMWLPDKLDFNPNIDPDLSNIYLNRNFTHNIGPSLRINTGIGNISAGVTYQISDMHSERQYPQSSQGTIERTFHDFSYNVNARLNLNRQNMLNVSASSSTSNPSITQLQDVTDVSSLSNITSGNPNLKPTFSNSARANYVYSNIAGGRTFMVSANYSNTLNSIVDSLVINQPDFIIPATGEKLGAGNQFVKPVNLDGRWSASGNISYGFPVNFIKSNFTINGGASISESPSIINGDVNTMQTVTYNGGVQVGSNINEFVDFTIRYNGSYSISSNSSELRARNNNEYMSQSASAQLRWIFWKGITFTGNVSYSQYKGITTDYNTETTLINIYFGKKLFKSQRGELSIGVNDLLDQNKAFSRSVSATSISNSTSMVMGRYVAVQFIYNLRSFQASSSNGSRFQMGGRGGRGGGFDNMGGGRPMGGGGRPGGGRPF
ncbi:MAG: TonB-dependent receptor, partial [Tidjanibacter sp.]|nr:TonB-dependent receptor [Tidjanibacter sp.]